MSKKKKAKKKVNYLPGLVFDSSGSAMIRFAGPLALIDVHWTKFGTKVAQSKLVCAGVDQDDADGMLANVTATQACRACKNGVPKAERAIAVGWDVGQSRWCTFMGARKVFAEAFAKSKPHGVTKESMEAGDGLNVILQRVKFNTLVEVVPGPIDRPQGDDDPPDLDVIVENLRKKSLWRQYDTPEQLSSEYEKLDQAFSQVEGTDLYYLKASPSFVSLQKAYGLWSKDKPVWSDAEAKDLQSMHGIVVGHDLSAQPKPVTKANGKNKNKNKNDKKADEHKDLDDGSDLVVRNRWELI